MQVQARDADLYVQMEEKDKSDIKNPKVIKNLAISVG
jgi:hypothetical protein